ncbi:MAG: alpha/beta fold hydrolase [Desulfobacterales bacterium]|nr:alpha/beta fold hydrolase [Desulfobacterales bacterium]
MNSLPLYPFTPKQLEIDGHCLSYLDEGHGPVIVMLHGNPTWSFFFRNLVLLLRDRYRLIVPDHIGCGLSDKPRDYPYRLADHIANVEQLLAHLRVDRYSLVVHDWGGAIGMGVAGRTPERVQGLVVMNSAAFRSPRIPLRIRVCRTPLLGDLLVRGLNGFARPAISMAVTKKMDKETARGYLAPYDSWRNRVAVLGFVRDIPLSPGDPSWETLVEIEQRLAELRNTPMLVLWGGRDFCFNRYFYDEWLRRFPTAEAHFFPEAGHYLLEDAFAEIGPLVEDFFARLQPPVSPE